jgi:hypothetical protein
MRPAAVPPATGHLISAEDDPAGRLLGAWRLVTNLRRMEDTGEVVEPPTLAATPSSSPAAA